MQYQSPFISYARPDVKGIRAQVKVETGLLPVKSIQDAGKMKKVTFDISAFGNAKLKRDPYANINPSEEAFAAIEEAHKAGNPVAFRIEAQRKASLKLASTTPMKELDAQSQTARCLVAVNGITTGEARTDASEDQMFSGVAAEQADDFLDVSGAAAASGSVLSEEKAREVFARLRAAEASGKDLKVSDVFGAIAMVFGVDVYAAGNR